MSPSENKILARIKRTMLPPESKYMFWFIYDNKGNAIDFEGGTDLPLTPHFRNQHTMQTGKKLVTNW